MRAGLDYCSLTDFLTLGPGLDDVLHAISTASWIRFLPDFDFQFN